MADLVEVFNHELVADLQKFEEKVESILVNVEFTAVYVLQEAQNCLIRVVIYLEYAFLGLLHL